MTDDDARRCLPCWSAGTPCREHTDTPPEHVPGKGDLLEELG